MKKVSKQFVGAILYILSGWVAYLGSMYIGTDFVGFMMWTGFAIFPLAIGGIALIISGYLDK
uniref:Uncharacterized protein n=1 Tax=uncultured marine virus TaxID=186617 RepID=A0A0F7L7M3_9VIRU|nr:hypothetical protein [uncultured marine virus]